MLVKSSLFDLPILAICRYFFYTDESVKDEIAINFPKKYPRCGLCKPTNGDV